MRCCGVSQTPNFTQKKERGFSKKVSLSFLANITIKILFNSVHNKHSHRACGRNAYCGYCSHKF